MRHPLFEAQIEDRDGDPRLQRQFSGDVRLLGAARAAESRARSPHAPEHRNHPHLVACCRALPVHRRQVGERLFFHRHHRGEFILSGGGLDYAIAYAYEAFDNHTTYALNLLVLVVATAIDRRQVTEDGRRRKNSERNAAKTNAAAIGGAIHAYPYLASSLSSKLLISEFRRHVASWPFADIRIVATDVRCRG
jgi:hypothetical protein